MGVRKIFIVLVTIVACVILGAFVLNVLLPGTTKSVINATETMLYNATGMKLDLNGDGKGGNEGVAFNTTDNTATTGGKVDGYTKE